MITHSQGYIFDARLDSDGKKVGILESYKYFNKTVDIIFGVNQTGHITRAVYCDKHLGFKCLSDICIDDEKIDLFLKSRRGTYAVIGIATMVGVAKINIVTNEIRNLDLYTPISDTVCDGKPVVICDKLSTVRGFHHKVISTGIYNSIRDTVVNDLMTVVDLKDKKSYLKSRL